MGSLQGVDSQSLNVPLELTQEQNDDFFSEIAEGLSDVGEE